MLIVSFGIVLVTNYRTNNRSRLLLEGSYLFIRKVNQLISRLIRHATFNERISEKCKFKRIPDNLD